MSASPIDGYLTKKEIEEKFQRSHRSLTRDFSNAVRVGNLEILQHLKLRTDDGDEIVGTEVTLEKIQELSNSGLSPTWYAKREWVQERYAKEDVKKTVKQEEGSDVSPVEERPVVTASNGELVSTLRSQIVRLELENDRRADEHRQDKESFVEQIKMFKDMFDTLKDDHTDTKGLLKEVHQVMGKFADVSLLGSQVGSSETKTSETPTDQNSDVVVDVERGSAVDAVIVDEPVKKRKTSTKQGNRKSDSKKSTAKPKVKAKSKPQSHKWYETPTLNQFLSRK